MNKVLRKNSKLIKAISAISAAAIVTGGIAFYLSKDTRVLASAVEEGKEVPLYMDAISAINYATILGRSTDFGIVANNFEQVTHMETTFAVNTFSNISGQVNEVDFITDSAQFIVGRIGAGKIKFGGNQTAANYTIESTNDVFANYNYNLANGNIFNDSDVNTSNFYFDPARNVWVGENPHPVYTIIKDEAEINASIDSVITSARVSSDYISQRAQDPNYALDYTQYLTLESMNKDPYNPMDQNTGNITQANRMFIDIDKAEFVNRVVYINVDANLARAMANSEGLCIIKDPSTVVCFNIEPGITNGQDEALILNRICVSEDGGKNFCCSVTASQGDNNSYQSNSSGLGTENTANFNNDDVDRMINQKIIFNVRSNSQNIQLDAIAGTTLIPNPSAAANVRGSSTGWVVSGGLLRNDGGEWHYIYKGVSQDAFNNSGNQEIHFALHKAFTSDNGVTVDNSVYMAANDYTFNLYKLDNLTHLDSDTSVANYDAAGVFASISMSSINGATSITAQNSATGNVFFQSLELNDTGDYYYIVTENPTPVHEGISNTDGYIKIHVKVESVPEAAHKYTVEYCYYLNAGDTTPIRQEHDVVMMGVQFDLGNFFNSVEATGSIAIDKSVLGVTTLPEDYTVPVYVRSGSTYYYMDRDGSLKTSNTEHTF
ncbi:MAG: hypothetical protein MJ103_04545, partial [Saccharofermentans sp.]|nr:hypothetical protein [Saccharofermentans sp.]